MLKFATDANGNLQYLRILKTQDKPAPRSGQTQTGYGSRIPCGFLAQTEEGGPFRRVYCRVFSNIGTCYVLKKGEAWIVETL